MKVRKARRAVNGASLTQDDSATACRHAKITPGRTGQKLGQTMGFGSNHATMMTEAAVESLLNGPGANVCFVGADMREKLLKRSESEGWLPVPVSMPGPRGRGRLGVVLEESIEKILELRGACPPGIAACADSDASLSDQLYRARLLGAPGLALGIERLESIANHAGALDAEDSAVLRWWVMTARERPLRIYFDSNDEALGIYTAPTHLGTLVRDAEELDLRPSTPPPVDVQMDASIRSMLPVTILEDDTVASVEPDAEAPDSADCSAIIGESAAEPATPHSPEAAIAPAEPAAHSSLPQMDPIAVAQQPSTPVPPLFPEAAGRWRDWMRTLDEARGPRPLGAVEQLYVNAYVPLHDAASRGIAGPEAIEVLETWSSSFARSYSEAFDALRLRGKRPMMVLDIADVAHRLGRLHGARSVQLVLVRQPSLRLGIANRIADAPNARSAGDDDGETLALERIAFQHGHSIGTLGSRARWAQEFRTACGVQCIRGPWPRSRHVAAHSNWGPRCHEARHGGR